MSLHDSYRTLGISPNSTRAEVKQAYRDLVTVWHPDRFARDGRLQRKAEDQLKVINIAYDQIRRAQRAQPADDEDAPAAEPVVATPPRPTQRWRRLVAQRRVLLFAPTALGFLLGFWVARAADFQLDWIRAPETAAGATVSGGTPPAVSAAPPPESPPAEDLFFTVGSSKEHVARVEGRPAAVDGDTWWYGQDYVRFGAEGVESYSNGSGKLNSRLLFTPPTNGPELFSVGSTRDEVVAVQGVPTTLTRNTWWYGASFVEFGPAGRVQRYQDRGNLRTE